MAMLMTFCMHPIGKVAYTINVIYGPKNFIQFFLTFKNTLLNGIYHAFCYKLHLKGCNGSNLAYLVRETTTRRYLVPFRACSSIMPLLVTQPALHLPPPLLPWCGSRLIPALVHLIPDSC